MVGEVVGERRKVRPFFIPFGENTYFIYFSADGFSYNLLTVAVAPQRHFQTSE